MKPAHQSESLARYDRKDLVHRQRRKNREAAPNSGTRRTVDRKHEIAAPVAIRIAQLHRERELPSRVHTSGVKMSNKVVGNISFVQQHGRGIEGREAGQVEPPVPVVGGADRA